MHIAIVVPKMPPSFSGAGKRGWRMAKALSGRGFTVSVLTFTPTPRGHEGIHVFALKGWAWRYRFSRRSSILRRLVGGVAAASTMLEASRILARNKPDVLLQIGCDLGPQLLGLVALLLRIPVVAEGTLLGGDDALSIQASPFGKLRIHALKACSAVSGISPALVQAAIEAGIEEDRTILLPNGVDGRKFYPPQKGERAAVRETHQIANDAVVFLAVGAISRRKGTLDIVQAFALVRRQIPNALLLLVGPTSWEEDEGPEAAYAQSVRVCATQDDVSGSVRFLGTVSNVAELMRGSDMLVHAATAEGFPTVWIEGLASGLPLVVRSIPGIADFIVPSSLPGTHVVSAPEGIAPAMLSLAQGVGCEPFSVQNAEMRRSATLERFGDEKILDEYVALLRRVST